MNALRQILLVMIVFGSWCAAVTAQTNSAKLYRDGAPGVALVGNREGYVSATVMSGDGLLIASSYITSSLLPLEAIVAVKENGQIVEKTFPVSVRKCHPTYDLVLLKIEQLQGELVSLPESRQAPADGAHVYVIGNPGGNFGDAPCKAILEGTISKRKSPGDKLGIKAPVNLETVGAALVTQDGELLGILTEVEDPQKRANQGSFALLNEVRIESFKEVYRRTRNAAEAERLFQRGLPWWDLAFETHDPAVSVLGFRLALYWYRQAFAADTSNASMAIHVGHALIMLDEGENALDYCNAALQMEPDNVFAEYLQGKAWMQMGRLEEALQSWMDTALTYDSSAAGAADIYFERQDYAKAAYLSQCALVLISKLPEDTLGLNDAIMRSNLLLQRCKPHLKTTLIRSLMAKSRPQDFSLKELDATSSLTPATPASKAESKSAAKGESDTAALIADLIRRGPAGKQLTSPVSVKSANPIGRIYPAYYGLKVLTVEMWTGKLGLIDLMNPEKIDYLNVGFETKGATLATGGATLVARPAGSLTLHIYNLATQSEKKLTLVAKFGDAQLFMGRNCGDQLLMRVKDEVYLLDLKQSRARLLGAVKGTGLATDPELTALVTTDGDAYAITPSGMRSMGKYKCDDYGFNGVCFDDQMTHVIFQNGKLAQMANGNCQEFPYTKLMGVAGGPYLLALDVGQPRYTVYSLPDLASVHANDLVEGIMNAYNCVANAQINRLVYCGISDVIVQRLLPHQGGNDGGGASSLARGETWTHQLEIPDGVKVKLEFAPESCKLQGKQLTWTVPAESPGGVVRIVLSLERADGIFDYLVVPVLVE